MPLPIPQLNNLQSQQGFTLLELLVVVGILAVIAGSTIFANRSQTIDNAKVTAAITEMQNIRHALLQYKTDNFELPDQESPADFAFLFVKPTDDNNSDGEEDIQPWNHDYQTGWRGPYLSSGDSGLVDMSDNLDITGKKIHEDTNEKNLFVVTSSAKTLIRGIPDPFSFKAIHALPDPATFGSPTFTAALALIDARTPCNETIDNNQCLLDWRLVGQDDPDDPDFPYLPLAQKGRPYLAFDLDARDKARIVSMGPNGKYDIGKMLDSDGDEVSCASYPNTTDDLILCLY